jgi:hypothetical protein
MNTAATTLGLLSLPQFYSTKQVSSTSSTLTGNSLTNTLTGPSLTETEYKNPVSQAILVSSATAPPSVNSQFIHQQSSQFQTTNSSLLLPNQYNNFQAFQNQQITSQQQKELPATSRSITNTTQNLMQQQPLVNVNNSINVTNNHHIQNNQQQPALIESLVQSVPNATSTPNPIQQQQQQQDIFTNLLLKFDPSSFFHKKNNMSDQLFNVSNLNGFNLSQINSNSTNNQSGKTINNTLNDPKKVNIDNLEQLFNFPVLKFLLLITYLIKI